MAELKGVIRGFGGGLADALWRAPMMPAVPVLNPVVRNTPWLRWISAMVLVGFTGGMFAATYPVMISRPGDPVWLFLALLQTAPLLLSWTTPILAWRLLAIGMIASIFFAEPGLTWPWAPGACIAYAKVLMLVGTACERRVAVAVGAFSAGAIVLPAAVVLGMDGIIAMLALLMVTVPLILGDAVRARRTAERALAGSEEERRAEATARAVLEERARIARELHDVVAHHMSVIAVQAEAAQVRIPELPDQARATFQTIKGAAREALAETRRVVGLLRSDTGERAARAPQPDLARIQELVEEVRGVGMLVTLNVVGTPGPLPVGVGLSAYRIVQESLSNARKHAPGAPVTVEILYGGADISLCVRNGPAPRQPFDVASKRAPGHGLLGMRERVAVLGGRLDAGPAEDGGFVVKAWIPLQ